MPDTPHRPDASWISLPAPPEGAWMCPPLAPLVLSSDQGSDFALIPISPAGMRLAQAIARTKGHLSAITPRPVSDRQALAYLQKTCAREDHSDGPVCLQEGSPWCEEHCPFHDFSNLDGPLAWG